MIVVADTSPLNYLILLGHSEILFSLFGRVLAPEAVVIEMQHPDAPAHVRIWAASPPRVAGASASQGIGQEPGRGTRHGRTGSDQPGA